MNNMEYLEIILKGYCEDASNLTNHIYREWKKAEMNHYTIVEFFEGLISQQKRLKAYIDNKRLERKNEVAIIRGIWESEGKDTKELEGQEDIQYTVNLFHFTNDPKYLGIILGQPNIDYIGGQIADACEKAGRENKLALENILMGKDGKPKFFYDMPERNILPSEATFLDPQKMQRVVELAKRLNDLDFSKELIKKEAGQIKENLEFHLRTYLRNGGNQNEWINHTKKLMPIDFSPLQRDTFLSWFEEKELNNAKPIKRVPQDFKTFTDIFYNNDAYEKVINLLKKETLIDNSSLKWIDISLGYKSKVAALLYHLYHNKYFNCIEIPKPEQIKFLAKSGFNVDITVRTIKDKKVNDLRKEFSFIKRFTPCS